MIKQVFQTEIILYVKDQEASTQFYRKLLRNDHELHVPGMTEFVISEHLKLGLMPSAGIVRLLGDSIEDPEKASGIPRCELYFLVEDAEAECQHAIQSGAKMISPLTTRDWGDMVGYVADPDGHVIAFAQRM
jgi:uncharacterized glyoxalase superfamily protein PhnB